MLGRYGTGLTARECLHAPLGSIGEVRATALVPVGWTIGEP